MVAILSKPQCVNINEFMIFSCRVSITKVTQFWMLTYWVQKNYSSTTATNMFMLGGAWVWLNLLSSVSCNDLTFNLTKQWPDPMLTVIGTLRNKFKWH